MVEIHIVQFGKTMPILAQVFPVLYGFEALNIVLPGIRSPVWLFLNIITYLNSL